MTNIPLPRLIYSPKPAENATLPKEYHPIRVSITENITPLSTATIELPKGENLTARGYVELFTPKGSAGVFRVRSPEDAYGDEITRAELEHAITEVGDYLVTHEYSEMMAAGTAMQTIFGYYTSGHASGETARWQLNATALPSSNVAVTVNHERVLDAMLAILEQVPNYMMAFNFETSPWTVYFKQRDQQVTAEGRLSRNIESARITYDDSDLCTRVYYERQKANSEETEWVFKDADTISTYGMIQRSMSVSTNYTTAEANAAADEYLRQHKEPRISIEVSAEDLHNATGEGLDSFLLGKLMRITIPDYEITQEKTITKISWSDVYNKGYASVNLTLGQERDTAIKFLHDIDSSGGSASGGRSSGRISRTMNSTNQIIDLYKSKTDNNGEILEAAGLALDEHGTIIYHDDYENQIGSRIQVTEGMASMSVGQLDIPQNKIVTVTTYANLPATGESDKYYKVEEPEAAWYVWEGNSQSGSYKRIAVSYDGKHKYYIKAAEIAVAINETTGESTATIDGNHIKIGNDGTKDITLTSKDQVTVGLFERDASGNIILDGGSGLIVKKTQDGTTVSNGIWDKGELSAGIFSTKNENGTYTKIKGSSVNIGDGNTNEVTIKDAFEIATYNQQSVIKLKKPTLLSDNLYVIGGDIEASTSNGSGGDVKGKNVKIKYQGGLTFEAQNPTAADPTIERSDALGLKDTYSHAQLVDNNDGTATLWYLPATTPVTLGILPPSEENGWISSGTFSKATQLLGALSGTDGSKTLTISGSPTQTPALEYTISFVGSPDKLFELENPITPAPTASSTNLKSADRKKLNVPMKVLWIDQSSETEHNIYQTTISKVNASAVYDNGWKKAWGDFASKILDSQKDPETDTLVANQIWVKYPNDNVDGNPVYRRYTVDADAEKAYIKLGNTKVAEMTHNQYALGQASVGVEYDSSYTPSGGSSTIKAVKPSVGGVAYIPITLDSGTLNTTTGKRTIAAKAGNVTVQSDEISDYATGKASVNTKVSYDSNFVPPNQSAAIKVIKYASSGGYDYLRVWQRVNELTGSGASAHRTVETFAGSSQVDESDITDYGTGYTAGNAHRGSRINGFAQSQETTSNLLQADKVYELTSQYTDASGNWQDGGTYLIKTPPGGSVTWPSAISRISSTPSETQSASFTANGTTKSYTIDIGDFTNAQGQTVNAARLTNDGSVVAALDINGLLTNMFVAGENNIKNAGGEYPVSSNGDFTLNQYVTILHVGVSGSHSPSISSGDIWTTDRTLSGWTRADTLKSKYEQAKRDSEYVAFKVKCGGEEHVYYMEP